MKNIVVNFESKTIELTKNFSKRAGVAGTPEYHTLVGVMRDFPDYTLRVKRTPSHHTPSPYSRLTYEDMEAMIMRCEDADMREELLTRFNTIKLSGKYFEVKQWFIQTRLADECRECVVA
jgi:hypothetical protein